MDNRAKGAPRARAREASTPVGGLPAGDAGSVVDGAEQDSAQEPAQGPDVPRAPSVHGADVRELMLLMRQGEQAWLLTTDGGSHEFARVFWCDQDGKGARYRVGQGGAPKLGRFDLLHVAVDARGATLTWSGDRKSWIPADYFQYTWS